MQDSPPRPAQTINRVQVWCPEILKPDACEEWQHNLKAYCQRMHQAMFIVYDELTALIYKAGDYSEEYRRIQKVGGGLDLGTISHTQELGGIPPTAYGQCQHFLCWRIKTGYDTTVATSLLGSKPKFGPKYSFLYKYQEDDEPAYLYENIQAFV